jgi:hypothetical protein
MTEGCPYLASKTLRGCKKDRWAGAFELFAPEIHITSFMARGEVVAMKEMGPPKSQTAFKMTVDPKLQNCALSL